MGSDHPTLILNIFSWGCCMYCRLNLRLCVNAMLFAILKIWKSPGGWLLSVNLFKLHNWYCGKPATLLKVTHLHGCFSRYLNCTIGTVRNCNCVQQKISENHINFDASFHCKCTIAIKLNLQKQYIKYTKGGLFCCLLSLF